MNDEPLEENWAPSEWRADVKVGSLNRTTPARVLEAVGRVKEGKTATLGKLYQSEVPLFGRHAINVLGRPRDGQSRRRHR